MTKYLAFEGIDGSGKTKQISLLVHYLKELGRSIFLTKEFGSQHSLTCTAIRELTLSDRYELDELAGQQMFAACSTQHSEQVLAPALGEYDYIISDRSIESNLAYGNARADLYRGVTREIIHDLFHMDQRRIYPDKIIFLNVKPDTAWARLVQREPEKFDGGVDRVEAKGLSFQKRVYAEYCRRIEGHPNYIVINCEEAGIEETHQMIIEALNI